MELNATRYEKPTSLSSRMAVLTLKSPLPCISVASSSATSRPPSLTPPPFSCMLVPPEIWRGPGVSNTARNILHHPMMMTRILVGRGRDEIRRAHRAGNYLPEQLSA
eukprot:278064-Hanusia_phi.AAC.3